ncbi:DUF4124 domain-containing protein [Azonexus sp. IMCC34842]|uniref:DUF4124 domain-containing protein n=1 Tax=Azonexus sp. IMCC34842 TaxID=3420950 RepID=UPI003D118F2F
MNKILLTLFAACLLALPVQAEIYKCRLPNGKTEIANSPCPTGSGTLTVRPDDTVPEETRQQAERDVARMRNYVDQREAAQRADEAAERQRQAGERQAAALQGVYQSDSMSECLRELAQHPVDAARRAELEAICRAKAKTEPAVVQVPVFGGGGLGGAVDHCVQNVLRLRLAPAEQNRRMTLCQGNYGQPPGPAPHPAPHPEVKPGKPCPRNDKFCVR